MRILDYQPFDSPPGATCALQNLPPKPQIQKLLSLNGLAKRDPVDALEWASGRGEKSDTLLDRVANTWIFQAPEAAINWLRDSQGQTRSIEAIDKFLTDTMTHKPSRDMILPNLSPKNKAWLTARFPEDE